MKKIFDLLQFFEIENYYISNNLIISKCPIHDGDNITAFNINIDEENIEHYGKWFCNTKSCHNDKSNNDVLSLVWMLLEKKYNKELTFPEVVKFCKKFCSDVKIDANIKYVKTNDAIDKLINIEAKKTKKNTSSKFTREIIREHLKFPADFYIKRGFSKEILDIFDVGVCNNPKSQMYNRVVFPVFDENDEFMIGCTGRTICNDPKKWINQKGFNKSNFLYNYGKALKHIQRTETIIIVEGQGDVIRLWEAGIHNAVGIFGSKISDSQEFLIQKTGVSNVVIMTDNDEAGISCANDIKEKLQFLFNIYIVDLPKKDIGEMTIQEINSLIKPKLQGKF